MSKGTIDAQRPFREMARDVNKLQVSTFYIYFYHTVEGSERNNDGKLFSPMESATVYI